MTSAEYQSSYAKSRKLWPSLTAKTMRKIKAVYREQGRIVASIIAQGTITNGQLDQDTQRKLDHALLVASAEVGNVLREEIPALLATAAAMGVAIETRFLTEAWGKLGAKLSEAGIGKMFGKVTEQTITKTLGSPWLQKLPNGSFKTIPSFWANVPNVSKNFSDDVVSMVRAALAQGRDVGKIASDVNVFVKDGKFQTIKRWGERLEPSSKELLRRVRFDKVDYRALRLARSELGRGLMETAKANGQANPGGTGLWDWVRTNIIDWGCNCPANAANGPYLLENLPGYDHPQDQCTVRQRLKDGNTFRDELKRWANGESVPELDEWYRNTYLQNQA